MSMKLVKSTLLPVILLCIALALSFNPVVRSSSDAAGLLISGEIIVEIKPTATIQEINDRNRTATVQRIDGTNFYLLQIPPGKDEAKWLKRLSDDKDVLSASFNPIVMSPTIVFGRATVGFPGDRPHPGLKRAEYVYQPALTNMLALRDVRLRSRGAGVVVAVIDTGIDRTHPDLVSRMWKDSGRDSDVENDGIDNDLDGLVDDYAGWDFIDNDNDPTETPADPETTDAGHGTFIAGLITLVAPECRILPVRAFTSDGMSNAFTVAAAIKYAADHGADVINLSFGSTKKSRVVRDAVKYARQRGAVLVAAAGNENENTDEFPQYPAGLRQVISVAAIDEESRKSVFSNYGSDVSVAAPGVQLASAYPGEDYARWSGTSFTAPLAAAQAALLLAQDRNINARATIEATADRLDYLNPDYSGKLGHGRINLLASLDSYYDNQSPSGNYAYIYLREQSCHSTARVKADVVITGSRQELILSARGLKARARYSLFVNGKEISPEGFTSSNFGGLVITLSNDQYTVEDTDSVRLALPAKLYPVTRIKRIELRNEDGTALEGAFTPAVGITGPAGETIAKQTPLASLTEARGKAFVRLDGRHEELRVEVNRLMPDAIYNVFVDGVSLGSAIARAESKQSGFLRIRLTADGSSGLTLPPQLRPVMSIKRVEVRDLSNVIVLQGDFLSGGDDFGRGRP
jgi:subtilisin family serine protease